MRQTETINEFEESSEDCEKVYVSFTDDVCISNEEKELVISINVEWSFEVPINNKYVDDNYVLIDSHLGDGEI